MAPRSLSLGMNGEDVRAIQNALNLYPDLPGAPLNPDGRFGSLTDAKVRPFQSLKGLAADGVFGRRTRLAMFPFGVATTTILGTRFVLPSIGPSLRTPGFSPVGLPRPTNTPPLTTLNVDWDQILAGLRSGIQYGGPSLAPIRIPRAEPRLPAPIVPELTLPPLPGAPNRLPLGFVYDHMELAPGAQTTFALGSPTQSAFTVTIQSVYRRGPDDGAHQEIATGVQTSGVIPSGFPSDAPWSITPFVQLTDVDRIAALGPVHLWQPYAQIGVQFQGPGDAHPTIGGSLFPLNIGIDITGALTWTLAGGAIANLDLSNGQFSVGLQASTGLTVKFGAPPPR